MSVCGVHTHSPPSLCLTCRLFTEPRRRGEAPGQQLARVLRRASRGRAVCRFLRSSPTLNTRNTSAKGALVSRPGESPPHAPHLSLPLLLFIHSPFSRCSLPTPPPLAVSATCVCVFVCVACSVSTSLSFLVVFWSPLSAELVPCQTSISLPPPSHPFLVPLCPSLLDSVAHLRLLTLGWPFGFPFTFSCFLLGLLSRPLILPLFSRCRRCNCVLASHPGDSARVSAHEPHPLRCACAPPRESEGEIHRQAGIYLCGGVFWRIAIGVHLFCSVLRRPPNVDPPVHVVLLGLPRNSKPTSPSLPLPPAFPCSPSDLISPHL